MPHPPIRSGYRWVALFTVLFGLFTYGTITTIISASLNTVADDLGASTNALAWAITGPFLALGIGNPIFGKIGDLYGRRRFFLLGMTVFTVASLGCAIAPNAIILIALRAVAGLGASAATPNGMAIVMHAFSPEERPKALGWFNLFGVGAPALGLALGGLMVDALGWRAVFWVYGIIACAATTLAFFVVRDSDKGTREPIDFAGAAALAVAALALALGLTLGASDGFGAPLVLILLGASPVALASFASIERRSAFPLAPPAYFANRSFSAPLLGYFAGHVTYMGAFVITPILLQDTFGYRAATISAVLLVRPLSYSLTSPIAGLFTTRVGDRTASIVAAFPLIAGAAFFLAAAEADSALLVALGLLFSGVGLGLVTPPYVSALTSAVKDSELGLASGMLQMSASLGTVVGIQVAVMLLGEAKPHVGSDFVWPYAVGVGAAVVLLVASTLLPRPTDRIA